MEKRVKSILPKPVLSPVPNTGISTKRKQPTAPGNETKKRNSSSSLSAAGTGTGTTSSINNHHNAQSKQPAGHRPVTLCTFCRQHKIKCNASENYPSPCLRCEKMNLKCEIDPKFRPKKGSQIKLLMSDVDDLKSKIEMLTKNELLLTQALNQHNLNYLQQLQQQLNFFPRSNNSTPVQRPTLLPSVSSPHFLLDPDTPRQQQPMDFVGNIQPNPNLGSLSESSVHSVGLINDATPQRQHQTLPTAPLQQSSLDNSPDEDYQSKYPVINEFVLGTVVLPLDKANELHEVFVTKYLPFMPIFTSGSATSLYHKSQLLFWTCMLTAALLEPEPSLYMSLASLIKQLAIETCWIRTPRSTHVIQALIILSIWPLPNEKVLDDCLYRFIGLAKKLSLQLGLHRGGEFINEFSRNQVSLGPNADRWRTRSWLAVFFCEQFWLSVLGLPPLITTTDYLVESARIDTSLPSNFRCLISLSVFQCKLINVMGISLTSPDGLLEPLNRAGSLNILDRELERLRFKLPIGDGSSIEVYFLYLKLMICCFAFLPGTPIEDQVKYVSSAYLAATRIITLTSQMISNNTVGLVELPIYVRQAISYSVLLLFKLQMSRYLMDKYVDSARQLIVTVHRLMRNTVSSWKDLQNDISRTARLLENLNVVLFTYPEIFLTGTNEDGSPSIISRMRSHLTASLFYDLVWCVHEARRRAQLDKNQSPSEKKLEMTSEQEFEFRKPAPLPFYNQITKDDFKTITTTTPNGTTITTLVPTDEALNQAKLNATALGLKEPLSINGIPLSMLDATGSMNETKKAQLSTLNNPEMVDPNQNGTTSQTSHDVIVPAPDLPLQNIADFPTPSMHIGGLPLFVHDSPTVGNIRGNEPFHPEGPRPGGVSESGVKIAPNRRFGDPAAYVNYVENRGLNNMGMNEGGPNPTADQMVHILQQQSDGWLNNENYEDDDFLGWFDMISMPK